MRKSYILLTIISLLFIGCVERETNPSISQIKIDFSEYLPKKSMIKRYQNKSKVPWLKDEGSNIDEIKITIAKNRIFFFHNQEPISYESELKINKRVIQGYSTGFETEKTNRYVSIGDVTTINNDKYVKKRCLVKNFLKEFSHGGYSYKGDIIHEECVISRTRTVKGITVNVIDTYDRYSKKDLGLIAIINNSCYDNQRYANDKENCISNGYNYQYYIE